MTLNIPPSPILVCRSLPSGTGCMVLGIDWTRVHARWASYQPSYIHRALCFYLCIRNVYKLTPAGWSLQVQGQLGMASKTWGWGKESSFPAYHHVSVQLGFGVGSASGLENDLLTLSFCKDRADWKLSHNVGSQLSLCSQSHSLFQLTPSFMHRYPSLSIHGCVEFMSNKYLSF